MSAVWVLVLVAIFYNFAAGLILEQCREPLGMESGRILDRDITASSAYDAASVGPHHARLKNDKSGGAWCPRHMVTKEAREFLQVDLHSLHVITGTRTQGRFGNGQGQEYVEEFMLDYWRPGFTKWARWKSRNMKEKLTGNTNTYSVEEQIVDPPIRATKLRFVPFSDHVRTVCMRTELLGCLSHGGLISYSMRQGYLADDLDLRDLAYDGVDENGVLKDGLGQLADGERGQDNFRTGFQNGRKGNEWVGWKSDSLSQPLEIVFEFEKVRNFSAMKIHTNNMFSKDVQVFSRAEVFFSIGGRQFAPEPVSFSYMPDVIMAHARNVTVKLHQRIGRFLKVQLYFGAKFLLVSEISFDSAIVTANFTDEDEENGIPNTPDNGISKEFSLQRDDVQTTPSRDEHKVPGPSVTTNSGGGNRDYIGPVIGGLSTVIIILVAAILFMVYRNRRLKNTEATLPGGFTAIDCQKPGKIHSKAGLYGQVRLEDPEEKTAIYHEPFNVTKNTTMNMYSGVPTDRRPKESRISPDACHQMTKRDVPDILGHSSEYAVPHMVVPPKLPSSPPQSPSRPLPSLQDFLPKPPLVPPPDVNVDKELRRLSVSSQGGGLTDSGIRQNHPGVHSSASLSRLLTDATDSEFLPTETEGEDDDVTAVSEIKLHQLRVLEPLGYGQFGEVQVCEFLDTHELVAVKFFAKNADNAVHCDFKREVRILHRIQDDNIVRVLGANLETEPHFFVQEFSPLGDLNAFLQEHIADTATPLPCNAKTLSYGCLIYMATQIASGMKYLESLNFIHRDLAARNCIVSEGYHIRICDLGTCRTQYATDYVTLDGPPALPLRWMAWESVLLNKFSTKADVWAFAVTFWEILTFAREQPFEDLTDKEVLENVSSYYHNTGKYLLLERPKNCPKEIHDLMKECWQRNETDRPNFREIHLFLQRKNLGYRPPMLLHQGKLSPH